MSLDELFNAVVTGEEAKVVELVQAEVNLGTPLATILNDGLIAPLDVVGKKFSEGIFFLPEMLMAAQTVKSGLNLLRPLFPDTSGGGKGTVIMGTVKGDMHDIGKNLVILMMEGAGFKVIDLGVNVDTVVFLNAIRAAQPCVVGISALLTTTMPSMAATVETIKKEIPQTRIMVGGAPVTQAFAEKIGADGYGDNAYEAVQIVRKLMMG